MKSLSSIFSEYDPTELSNGQIRMMCPFRENHTKGDGLESFFVSPDIGAYHCFSCGAKGNLVKLLVNKFDVSYFDAIELGRLSTLTEKPKTVKKEYEFEIPWNEVSPKLFLDRGFKEKTLRRFKVGTDIEGWSVIPFIKENKFVGIQRRTEIGGERVVINTEGFNKREFLYNFDNSPDDIFIVEGYSDAWRMWQYGDWAVATLGVSISSWQLEQLRKKKRITIATDNDLPGRKFLETLYYYLYKHTEVDILIYEEKDPGEILSRKTWEFYTEECIVDYASYSLSRSMLDEDYLEWRDKIIKDLIPFM